MRLSRRFICHAGWILGFLISIMLIGLSNPLSVAASQSTFLIFGEYDGEVHASEADFATAWGADVGDGVGYTTKSSGAGHLVSGGDTTIYRSLLYFDTSGLPYNAQITSASVYLYGRSKTIFTHGVGNCNTTHGSNVVYGDATYWDDMYIGSKFRDVTESSAWYFVQSVASTTELRLDRNYEEAGAGSGDSYIMAEEWYLTEVKSVDVNTPMNIYDYKNIQASTNPLADFNVAEDDWSVSGYTEIPLATPSWAGADPIEALKAIQRNGVTIMAVRSIQDLALYGAYGYPDNNGNYIEWWAAEAGVDYRPYLVVNYTIPGLGTPSPFEIQDVAIFNNYKTDGDLLVTVRYACSYGDYDLDSSITQVSSDYFYVRIQQAGTMVAQTTLPRWGSAVASIYLAPDSAHLINIWGTYAVDIAGNDHKFSPNIDSPDYTISSSNWKGNNLLLLDAWCLSTATAIRPYYISGGTQQSLTVTVNSRQRLNSLGATVFEVGIPQLSSVRPAIFQVASIPAMITNYSHTLAYEGGPDPPTISLGNRTMSAFNGLGTYFGLGSSGGKYLAAAFWCFIMLIICGVVLVSTQNSVVAMLIALPMIFVGNYLTVLPMVITAFIGVVVIGMVLHHFWLSRT